MSKNKIAIILGVVCMALTIAICIQFKTIEDAKQTVGGYITDNSELKDEVLRWKDKYNNAYKELEELETFLETSRKRATQGSDEAAEIERNITLSNRLLGLTEVKGKGITVKLDDNREVNSETVIKIENYLIHDVDILQVVNELKNAGAEAISINGQRVVYTTGIICDGNVVRVNGEKLGAPFVIQAIGFPEKLYHALERTGGYLQEIRLDGAIAETQMSDDITIPKYEGIFTTEYIK